MSKNFGNLINTAVSDGYFQFKFEKNWSPSDVHGHNELLSLDVKMLANVLNCIPFNNYLQVGNEYFTVSIEIYYCEFNSIRIIIDFVFIIDRPDIPLQ